MVNGVEGTRALALELCREFEDKFLQHIGSGEVGLLFYLYTFFMVLFLHDKLVSFVFKVATVFISVIFLHKIVLSRIEFSCVHVYKKILII